jgi:trimethylamine--corrinoid protein Co-methyltransferase
MSLGIAQLARHYDLPTQRGGLGSSSKLLDAQAGYQKAISLIPSLLSMPDIAGGIGNLGPGTCLETMVIDNEIIDYALRYVEGLEVNDDTLALDVIDKVGPGGHFLGEKHTLQHFREGWMPEITDMETFEIWEKKGSKSIAQVAKEKTKEILATHKVEPVPEDVDREISRILKRAEAELLK